MTLEIIDCAQKQCEALKAEMVADYGASDRVPKRVVEAYRAAYKRARA